MNQPSGNLFRDLTRFTVAALAVGLVAGTLGALLGAILVFFRGLPSAFIAITAAAFGFPTAVTCWLMALWRRFLLHRQRRQR